jgi:hypothetical protein
MAALLDWIRHGRIYRDLLPPLFEPVLVMTDKQMTLHGYVIDASAHATAGIAHYSQYWVLQTVEPDTIR